MLTNLVVRAKITSAVKFEIPDLPDTPTPVVQKPDTRGNNKTKKPKKDVSPDPLRQIAPEPRVRRSLAAPSGLGGGLPGRGYYPVPQYQDVTIKRILKGVGQVENTVGMTVQGKNTTKHTRYVGRVYIRNPGFRLMPGKWYLLSGIIIQNKLWVSFCDIHQEWQALNLDQLHNLRKDFIHGCKKCRIQYCHPRDPGCEKRNNRMDVCSWRPDSYLPAADCSVKHSSCRAIKGKCQWKHSPRFAKCKQSKQSKLP
ncbi:hypothetical protein AC249_AIPGENE8114 [Exaiptasia diaphana]|nr:hypothetical protein AC249_AIPGENE8114 [Exaiptasia diaphana]